MPDFTYEAMAKAGGRSTGTLTANTEREAMMMLDGRGLFPLSITALKAKSAARWGKKVKGRITATFYSQLADLLHSGVPLLKSLDILERQSQNLVLCEVVREVRAKVADGETLADAMRPYPFVFDELSVSMVRAGQEGGFLEDVLRRIADFTEHAEDLKAKVVGSMAYPVFLAIIGIIVLNVLVIFVVPRFEKIFDKLKEKGELPGLTEALIGVSHFMQNNVLLIIAAMVVGFIFFLRWKRSDAGRLTFDRLKLKIPGAGKIFLALSISRFTRILGTLLHNGIPILRALEIAKDSTGNRVLADAIEQSAENITAGQRLADPLRRCPYFPHDIVEMIAIAEESNTLEKVLVDISIGLEKRTARQLELFVRLLEPVMLLVMASVTLLVVAGLLLPIFKMGQVVSGN